MVDIKTDIEELENIFNRSILKLFKDKSVSYQSQWLQFEQNLRTAISKFIGSAGNDTTKTKFMLEINTLCMNHSTGITNLETSYLEKCKTCLIKRRQVLVAAQTEILQSIQNTPPTPDKSATKPSPDKDSSHNTYINTQQELVSQEQPFFIGASASTRNDENTNNSNSNSGLRPFKCYYQNCDRDYTTQAYLFDHIRQTHKGKPYKCEDCGRRFSRKKDIEAHQKEEHPKHVQILRTKQDYKQLQVSMEKCPECDYTTSTLRSLCLHIRKKHKQLEKKLIEEKVFKVCSKCDHSYHCVQRHQCNRRNIKPHNFETTPRNSNESMQSKFGEIASLRYSMLSSSHEATTDEDTDIEMEHEIEDEPERKFKCEYKDCYKSFTQRKYLAKHIRGVHKGKPYKCEQCNTKFEYERELIQHQKQCRIYCICRKPQNQQPMISCDYCPEWYHYDCVGLTREVANNLKEYKCEACKNAQYCICRKPDDGKGLIQCDGCDEWYHYRCINLTTEEADAIDEYICSRCLNDAESRDISIAELIADDSPPRKKQRTKLNRDIVQL